jgi:hypothetical protein
MGNLYETGKWFYFPLLYMIKTPVPEIVFVLAGFFMLFKRKNSYVFLIPLCVYLLLAFNSKMQIGTRHLLPVYPLLFIAGGAAADFFLKNKYLKVVTAFLAIWLVFVNLKTYPDYIAYSNELVGGMDNGWKYHTDFQHGQGFGELIDFIKENNAELIANMSTALPGGIEAQDLYNPSHMNSLNPKKEYFAVCGDIFNLGRFDTDRKSSMQDMQFLKERTPDEVIAHSIFVYDITCNREIHLKIAEIYRKQSLAAYEKHELLRADCQKEMR